MDTIELINYIKNAKKTTFTVAYINGKIDYKKCKIKFFNSNDLTILIGEYDEIIKIIRENKEKILDYYLDIDRRNSKVPLLNYENINARIEPGAIIRDHVEIGDNAIIMMGAVINIGAKIGRETMIDMNAVIGGRAEIGVRCHIGACSVIAGVIEPASKLPVVIEDDCFIGAGSVILEGIKIGKNSVVGAGSVVIRDVEPGTVVAGNPAKFIKSKSELLKEKSRIVDELR